MTTIIDEHADEYESSFTRAAYIIANALKVSKRQASAQAVDIRKPPTQRQRFSTMGNPKAAQDWCFDVHGAVKHGAGTVGGTILVKVLSRQRKSQASSFTTVGREVGLSPTECKLMFRMALVAFLHWIDSHRIPDHWDEAYMPLVRCAADEVGIGCPMVAA